jgi:LPS sulfotransferase NodH
MPLEGAVPLRFVILAAPRSGSNFLCTLLNSHPEILCHHEVFNPTRIFYALEHRDGSFDLGTIEERDRAPLEFLEKLWSKSLGYPCVGFKMTRGQNERILAKVLGDPDVRKIVLKRHNRIKTFVSALVAERTGQWEVYSDADLIQHKPKVELKLEDLRRHMSENEAYYEGIDNVLRSTGQKALKIAYEDLGSAQAHSLLLGYLGVRDSLAPLIARSVKQNPNDLRRLVTNYDELLNALRGTELVAELLSSRN